MSFLRLWKWRWPECASLWMNAPARLSHNGCVNIGTRFFSVYDEGRGMDDEEIVQKAFDENYILVTNDKDFGEKMTNL